MTDLIAAACKAVNFWLTDSVNTVFDTLVSCICVMCLLQGSRLMGRPL